MRDFGSWNGAPVSCVRLANETLSAEVLTYGATLRALTVPDREGRPVDVVLGFDRLEDYVNHKCYFGATVGPTANRIAGASCALNGTPLRLTANDGANALHGGAAELDRKLWQIAALDEQAVTLLYAHPDGLGGIPGELRIAVTYWLEDDALLIEYRAVSDRDTLCNLTNHSYFNLDGHASGSILNHRIQLRAGCFTPTDAASIPTGELRSVANTPMDLRSLTRVGAHIDEAYDQLQNAGGYDHNWVLDEDADPAAELRAANTGIRLRMWTDRPGVQLYTGNYIPDGLRGKDGAVYRRRQGLCLEAQAFPDAPHHPAFPSIVLRAGREWVSRTVLRFDLAPAEP